MVGLRVMKNRALTAAYNFLSSPEDQRVIDVNALSTYTGGMGEAWGGDKFLGGFGITKNYEVVDHWLLRKRSKQLFTENLYARGLIRRLLTNEINKGLALEATPDAEILGLDREQLATWSENTERRASIWGKNPDLCDYRGARTFGALVGSRASARTIVRRRRLIVRWSASRCFFSFETSAALASAISSSAFRATPSWPDSASPGTACRGRRAFCPPTCALPGAS